MLPVLLQINRSQQKIETGTQIAPRTHYRCICACVHYAVRYSVRLTHTHSQHFTVYFLQLMVFNK